MQTIERIYPLQLDPSHPDDSSTLEIHLERYRYAAENVSGARILDMACGCGYGSALLAEQNPDKQVIGVDIDSGAIAYAHAHYQLPNLKYVCADATTFRDQPFDTIVCLETIEHLPGPRALVAHYSSLLARGGRIIASVPITPTRDGNPYHLSDFSRRSFLALFRAHGLSPLDEFEQIQSWQFQGIFKPAGTTTARSDGVGRNVLLFYTRHPLYVLGRIYSMLRYGFSNRYLTGVFVSPKS